MRQEPSAEVAELIAEAEAYCEAAGIKLATLGQYAIGNKHFFADRQAGRPCLTSTLDRVRKYMRDHPPSEKKRGRPVTEKAGATL